MVSMKDIAEKCGVSVATVSKALSGQKDISAETVKRIKEMAAELGYQTNAAARALRTNRSYNIGVLFFDEGHSGLTHNYFSAVLESVRTEAEKSGYDITFISANVGKRAATYLQHCRYRNVDGVIIACVDFRDPMVIELADSDIPLVSIDHVFNNCTAIVSDNMDGMTELTRKVIEAGHRNIAVIHGENTSVTQNRLRGFFRECEQHGISIREDRLKSSSYRNPEGCAQIVKELLKEEDRVTCIMFPDDYSAIGGIYAIRESGLMIPEDISVVGYDGIEIAQVLEPRITTWKQNTDELGKLAVRKLTALIERPRTTIPETVMVKGRFLEGTSLGSPKK